MKKNTRIAYYTTGSIVLVIMVSVLLFRISPSNLESQRNPPSGAPAHPFSSPSAPSKENVRQEYLQRVELLKRSVDAHPANAIHLITLARLLMDGHQIPEAVPYFERALKLQPANDSIIFDLSVCYYSLAKYQHSLELTDRILLHAPNNPVALYNKGALCASLGKPKEAEHYWKKLIAIAPQSEEAIKAKAGLSHLGNKNIP